jgi:protein-tyrosine phosphatase
MISGMKPATPVLLQSQPNFRDLGGFPTLDGRKIKSGMLFRSGDLHSWTDEELGNLEKLNIGTIIDFRSDRERENRPDSVLSSVKSIMNLVIPDLTREQATEYLASGNARGLEILLIEVYITMVNDNQREYKEFFNILAHTNHLPVLFHCAAGKDRTGLASLFLLTALGVDRELILEDYYSTNIHNREYSNRIIEKIHEMGLNGELMRPMMEVREEYLNAALNEIDLKYGGLNNFLTETLKADIETLKDRYLI